MAKLLFPGRVPINLRRENIKLKTCLFCGASLNQPNLSKRLRCSECGRENINPDLEDTHQIEIEQFS